MPEWTEGLTRVSDVDGTPGQAGTRYTVWFGRSSSAVEILASDRPRHVTWRVSNRLLTAEFETRFETRPHGARLTETIRTRGLIGWIWARILGTGSYTGSFRGELRVFAAICERGPAPPTA